MSKSIFTILKQCENCKEMFEAQKRTTRFCSHKCASQNYKLRKRLELKKEVETETLKQNSTRYKTKAVNLELIKSKEFVTVKELAILLGCAKDTVYRMIKNNEINAINLNKKLTRIRRKDVEQLFETSSPIISKKLLIEDCYTSEQIISKYNISVNTVYSLGAKYSVPKIKQGKFTYYSKTDIDKLFET